MRPVLAQHAQHRFQAAYRALPLRTASVAQVRSSSPADCVSVILGTTLPLRRLALPAARQWLVVPAAHRPPAALPATLEPTLSYRGAPVSAPQASTSPDRLASHA